MGFPTKLQRQFVSSQVESIFHFLSPSLTLIFALSLRLLIFVMFNLFVETEEIHPSGGPRRRGQMSGDNKGQTGPMGGQMGGWG